MNRTHRSASECAAPLVLAASMAIASPVLYGILHAAAGRAGGSLWRLAGAGFAAVDAQYFWVVAPGSAVLGLVLARLLRNTEPRLLSHVRRAALAGMMLGPINVFISFALWCAAAVWPARLLTEFTSILGVVAICGIVPGAICGGILGALAGLVHFAIRPRSPLSAIIVGD